MFAVFQLHRPTLCPLLGSEISDLTTLMIANATQMCVVLVKIGWISILLIKPVNRDHRFFFFFLKLRFMNKGGRKILNILSKFNFTDSMTSCIFVMFVREN